MRHLDLFSGIGGFALAASWVWGRDYVNVGHSEVEPYPCKVYHKHFPESECLGDITEITKWGSGVDLLTAGFPCQPHSLSGKRQASSDKRDLWGEVARAIRGVRPSYALLENVPGLLTSERGKSFGRVLRDLAEIGYDAEWTVLSAASVGAPHKRDRVWIVAYDAKARNGRLPIQSRESFAEGVNLNRGSEEVANTTCTATPRQREHGGQIYVGAASIRPGGSGSLRHATASRLPNWTGGKVEQPSPLTEFERPDGREVERDFRGISHGVSRRVDRLSGLGNAIVPQVAQVILQAIKDADDER